MPIDSTAVDLAFDGAIRNLTQLCGACSQPDVPAATAVVARLAEVRAQREPERRVLSAVLLQEFSSGWRGYDDASPALQAVMDAYNGAVARIVPAASATLVAPDGVAFLVGHAGDKGVDRVLRELRGALSTASWHRILLARPGRSAQRVGATELLFLSDGLLVVVDGRHCYGPARPPVLAAVGQGPRYIQLRDFSDQPVALDLELLQATEFQRPRVVRHKPTLCTIDDDGVVLAVGGAERRFSWGELAWSPLRPFEG